MPNAQHPVLYALFDSNGECSELCYTDPKTACALAVNGMNAVRYVPAGSISLEQVKIVDGYMRALSDLQKLREAASEVLHTCGRGFANRQYSPSKASAALWSLYDVMIAVGGIVPVRKGE